MLQFDYCVLYKCRKLICVSQKYLNLTDVHLLWLMRILKLYIKAKYESYPVISIHDDLQAVPGIISEVISTQEIYRRQGPTRPDVVIHQLMLEVKLITKYYLFE